MEQESITQEVQRLKATVLDQTKTIDELKSQLIIANEDVKKWRSAHNNVNERFLRAQGANDAYDTLIEKLVDKIS